MNLKSLLHILAEISLPLQLPMRQCAVSMVVVDQDWKQMEFSHEERTSYNQQETATYFHRDLQFNKLQTNFIKMFSLLFTKNLLTAW